MIEVDAKINQQDIKIDEILSLLTITTNNTDNNPKVSEITENTNGEENNNEEYDVNLSVDGAGKEIIEKGNEMIEEISTMIEEDNETNEVDDEETWGVTLDQMLSIKTATRLDMKG